MTTTRHIRPGRRALPGGEPTDEDLRRDIELTRQELGATVEALARRANVRDRAQQAVRGRATALRQALPGPVARPAFLVLHTVRHRPVVTAAGVVCVAVGVFALREVLRRRS